MRGSAVHWGAAGSRAAIGASRLSTLQSSFLVYAAVAVPLCWLYRGLRSEAHEVRRLAAPLRRSRGIVVRLALLVSVDSFGSRFVVQSMLALPALRAGTGSDGRDLLRCRAAGCLLAAARSGARGAHRTHQHDGLHAPAGERLLIAAALMPTVELTVASCPSACCAIARP